jgi:FKBP-type peptidyl-prolyl cis-trans isomerase (trigger factor)
MYPPMDIRKTLSSNSKTGQIIQKSVDSHRYFNIKQTIQMSKFYKREDLSEDTIQFKITIPKEDFKKEYNTLLKKELKDTDIKGFRKGKVPGDLVEPHVGHTLKIQAFEKLLPKYLEEALIEEKVNPIAPPEYKEFPDFKKDEALEFTMNITVMPDFKLGNLKKVKVKREDVQVEKKEVDEALNRLKENQETKAKEINDKWAKEIVEILKLEDVKDLEGLREHIKKAMLAQKEHMVAHKVEEEALQEAIKLSKIEIPEPAIKYEAAERERSFTSDMQQKGMDIDNFLKSNNITLEKMREMWEKDAKQALQTDVFLKLYAEDRNIEVTDEDLKKKIELVKKGAPEKTDEKIFEDKRWQEYVRRVEQKEKAFKEFSKEVLGEKEKKETKKDSKKNKKAKK